MPKIVPLSAIPPKSSPEASRAIMSKEYGMLIDLLADVDVTTHGVQCDPYAMGFTGEKPHQACVRFLNKRFAVMQLPYEASHREAHVFVRFKKQQVTK
jgi:hypothetical protein